MCVWFLLDSEDLCRSGRSSFEHNRSSRSSRTPPKKNKSFQPFFDPASADLQKWYGAPVSRLVFLFMFKVDSAGVVEREQVGGSGVLLGARDQK